MPHKKPCPATNGCFTPGRGCGMLALEVNSMEFQEVFTDLRRRAGYSQSEVADKVFVTRQAVSRWEQDGAVPEPETLLALSKLFGVSTNTLLGRPRTLVCQSCGMPLSDEFLAREADGSFNEDYCKWCWTDGGFAVDCTMEEMADICVPHMTHMDPEAAREYMMRILPSLSRWKPKEDAPSE